MAPAPQSARHVDPEPESTPGDGLSEERREELAALIAALVATAALLLWIKFFVI